MTDDPQLEELARDLHAIRAEPAPDFARELDRRAAEWLREGEPRRRKPWLRIAVPAAAAAAAIAIALVVVDGGSNDAETLDVAVVPADAAGGEALSAPAPQAERDSSADEAEGALLVRVHNPGDGDVIEVSYHVAERTRAQVRLGERDAAVDVPAGGGKLEISTEGLSPGTHDLEVTIPPIPTYGAPVEIRTPG